MLQQVKSLDDRISQALDPVGPMLDPFEKLAAGEGATATRRSSDAAP